MPGAITSPEGLVLITEDVVVVNINVSGLFEVRELTSQAQDGLLQAQDLLRELEKTEKIKNANIRGIVAIQRRRVAHLQRRLSVLRRDLPSKPASKSRVKRGLINLVGVISKHLFGTATDDDVAELGRKMVDVTNVVSSYSRVITRNHESIMEIRRVTNEIISTTNELVGILTPLIKEVESIIKVVYFGEQLTGLEEAVTLLERHLRNVVDNLVDATLNRVDSTLLPLHLLRSAILVASQGLKLKPIFDADNVELYYPILEAHLTETSIVCLIPMNSLSNYTLKRVIPFPVSANNTHLVLDLKETYLALSNDQKFIAKMDDQSLSRCKSSYLMLKVCPAYVLTSVPISESPCEVAILKQDSTTILHKCHFKSLELSTVFHSHIHHSRYFYFPRRTEVSVDCGKRTSLTEVMGYFTCPDYCEVQTKRLMAPASRQHLAFTVDPVDELKPLIPKFNFSLSVSVMKINSRRIEKLEMMNQTDFDSYLVSKFPTFTDHPHFIYNTLSQTGMVALVLGTIFLLYLGIRRMCARPIPPSKKVAVQTLPEAEDTV